MPVNTEGFAELVGQIEKMAHQLNTDEEGAPTAKRILQAAAQPIHQQMKANASHDPKIITGKLHGAINIGKVKRRRNGGQNITIGRAPKGLGRTRICARLCGIWAWRPSASARASLYPPRV